MAHGYTENQIIKFIYKECDLFEKLEMEFAMEEDSTLMESYESLLMGYKSLPKITFSPKKSSIDAILAYSYSA
jgi:hypothetical protein